MWSPEKSAELLRAAPQWAGEDAVRGRVML
jgi:hypothetical protein